MTMIVVVVDLAMVALFVGCLVGGTASECPAAS
jgi:hypothetical protein